MNDIRKHEKTLINESSLLIIFLIAQSLTASKINQVENGPRLPLNPFNLEYGMRSRGMIVILLFTVRTLLFSQFQEFNGFLV